MKRKRAHTTIKAMSVSRILPIVTLSAAATALALDLIGVLQATTAEQVIIALLGLLGVDALTERLKLFAELDKRLAAIAASSTLRARTEMPTIPDQARHAREIALLGVHATSAIVPHMEFYRGRLAEGCRMRVVLLDPESDAQAFFARMKSSSTTPREATVLSLVNLAELGEFIDTGALEVRLLDMFAPYSLFGVDLESRRGSILVEFQDSRKAMDSRPHIFLHAQDDPRWVEYFAKEFESNWARAKPWKGAASAA